jgi:hypothetical protein
LKVLSFGFGCSLSPILHTMAEVDQFFLKVFDIRVDTVLWAKRVPSTDGDQESKVLMSISQLKSHSAIATVAQPMATNHPTVAIPVTASQTHGRIGARLRALIEGVVLLDRRFGSVFTEFETHATPGYSQITSKFA